MAPDGAPDGAQARGSVVVVGAVRELRWRCIVDCLEGGLEHGPRWTHRVGAVRRRSGGWPSATVIVR